MLLSVSSFCSCLLPAIAANHGIIRWLDALQQVAITRFCARSTWTLSDPTHAPSHAKATSLNPITGQK
ncbi:hypothetical protein EMIT0P74_10045 [Pseudomonas sp. IT-P74]